MTSAREFTSFWPEDSRFRRRRWSNPGTVAAVELHVEPGAALSTECLFATYATSSACDVRRPLGFAGEIATSAYSRAWARRHVAFDIASGRTTRSRWASARGLPSKTVGTPSKRAVLGLAGRTAMTTEQQRLDSPCNGATRRTRQTRPSHDCADVGACPSGSGDPPPPAPPVTLTVRGRCSRFGAERYRRAVRRAGRRSVPSMRRHIGAAPVPRSDAAGFCRCLLAIPPLGAVLAVLPVVAWRYGLECIDRPSGWRTLHDAARPGGALSFCRTRRSTWGKTARHNG